MRPVAVALLLLLALPAAGIAAERKRAPKFYNARYCELLEITGEASDLTVRVWNTIGFSRCPARAWNALDIAAVRDDLGAFAVLRNGPRHFLMDRASARPAGGVRGFGGLRMRHIASVDVGGVDSLALPFYSERTILRRNTWVWKRGRVIHELLAPGRRRYVMQSYSLQVDPRQTVRSLRSLGLRLDLPRGWRYRARRLRRPLRLSVTRRATVVQDDLGNTYQRRR